MNKLVVNSENKQILHEALNDVKYFWEKEAQRLLTAFPKDAANYRDKCVILEQMIEELNNG